MPQDTPREVPDPFRFAPDPNRGPETIQDLCQEPGPAQKLNPELEYALNLFQEPGPVQKLNPESGTAPDLCHKPESVQDLNLELETPQAHVVRGADQVPVIRFYCLEKIPWLAHGFSTRLGGVSNDTYASMNLSFTRGDDPAAVSENFRRFGRACGIPEQNMIFSAQTHTTNLRLTGKSDCGKGILLPQDYTDIDGLLTNEPGAALVTFFADCIPLFFVDRKNRAIASSHAGWRGTAAGIGPETIRAMHNAYGTRPEDLLVVIGPGICKNCYEVSQDVADVFSKLFPGLERAKVLRPKENGRFLLDLWEANASLLEREGLRRTQIHVSGICTHCHPGLLWSHRTLGNARGSLAGFLMIRA